MSQSVSEKADLLYTRIEGIDRRKAGRLNPLEVMDIPEGKEAQQFVEPSHGTPRQRAPPAEVLDGRLGKSQTLAFAEENGRPENGRAMRARESAYRIDSVGTVVRVVNNVDHEKLLSSGFPEYGRVTHSIALAYSSDLAVIRCSSSHPGNWNKG